MVVVKKSDGLPLRFLLVFVSFFLFSFNLAALSVISLNIYRTRVDMRTPSGSLQASSVSVLVHSRHALLVNAKHYILLSRHPGLPRPTVNTLRVLL